MTSQRIGITHVIRLGLILSLSLLRFFANTGQSSACSCVPTSPSTALANSPSVFAGRIFFNEYSVTEDPHGLPNGRIEVVGFEVSTVWKGPRYETMYIRSIGHQSDCHFTHWGFYQRFGTELIVYAYDDFSVYLCSRMIPLDEAQEDLDLLGKGHKPKPGTIGPIPGAPEFPPQQSSDIEWIDPATAGCSLGSATPDAAWLGIMAGLVWFGVRRRPRR